MLLYYRLTLKIKHYLPRVENGFSAKATFTGKQDIMYRSRFADAVVRRAFTQWTIFKYFHSETIQENLNNSSKKKIKKKRKKEIIQFFVILSEQVYSERLYTNKSIHGGRRWWRSVPKILYCFLVFVYTSYTFAHLRDQYFICSFCRAAKSPGN